MLTEDWQQREGPEEGRKKEVEEEVEENRCTPKSRRQAPGQSTGCRQQAGRWTFKGGGGGGGGERDCGRPTGHP